MESRAIPSKWEVPGYIVISEWAGLDHVHLRLAYKIRNGRASEAFKYTYIEFQDNAEIRIRCAVDNCPVRLHVRRPDPAAEDQLKAPIVELDLNHGHSKPDKEMAPPGFDARSHVMNVHKAALHLHRPALAHLRELLKNFESPAAAMGSIEAFFHDFRRSRSKLVCRKQFDRRLEDEHFPEEVVEAAPRSTRAINRLPRDPPFASSDAIVARRKNPTRAARSAHGGPGASHSDDSGSDDQDSEDDDDDDDDNDNSVGGTNASSPQSSEKRPDRPRSASRSSAAIAGAPILGPHRSPFATFSVEVGPPSARKGRPDKGKRRASPTPFEEEASIHRKRRAGERVAPPERVASRATPGERHLTPGIRSRSEVKRDAEDHGAENDDLFLEGPPQDLGTADLRDSTPDPGPSRTGKDETKASAARQHARVSAPRQRSITTTPAHSSQSFAENASRSAFLLGSVGAGTPPSASPAPVPSTSNNDLERFLRDLQTDPDLSELLPNLQYRRIRTVEGLRNSVRHLRQETPEIMDFFSMLEPDIVSEGRHYPGVTRYEARRLVTLAQEQFRKQENPF